MDGSAPVGWRPDLQDEIPDAEKPEAGKNGSLGHQEASLAVLPDQDGALSVRALPQLDDEPAHPASWWRRYPNQTREHLFKVCPEWKAQRKILRAEVRKEAGRWKDRWNIRDLADERCGRAVLDSLSTTDVGRRVLAEGDAVSEVSGGAAGGSGGVGG